MTGRGTLFAVAAVLLLAAMSAAAVGPKGPYGPCEDCVRVEGKITSIDYDAMSLVVDTGGDVDITVQADENTIVKMGRNRTLTFDDLAVGQSIAACGEFDGEGGILYAVKINIKRCE